jgi:hypothetical protein
MVRNLVMALAVAASASVASADSFVWYTTANTNGNGAGPAGGTQGQGLDLTCNTEGPAGSCSWTINMMVNTGSGGLVQHHTDLRTAPGNGVSASNAALGAGQLFSGGDAFPGTPGTGAALLTSARGSTFAPGGIAANSTFTVLSFTLTRAYATGDLSVAPILVGTNPDSTWVWANTNGNYENVAFGANPAVPALEGLTAALPAITITNVPEPTSLGLLALGALAIVRRRVGR